MTRNAVKALLTELNATSGTIEGSAVITRDGLAIASLLPPDTDVDRLGAIAATMLSIAEKASTTLGRGLLEQVLIHGRNGFVLLVQVGSDAVLALVAKFDTRLGMLLHEAKVAAERIARIL